MKSRRGAGQSRGIRGCWFVFCTSHLAARCSARVARFPPALAPARGMIGRVLHTAASILCLLNTMNFQPTGKVGGVGQDFVRGGQDKTPTPKKNAIYEAHAEFLCRRHQRYKYVSVVERPKQRYGHRLKLAERINLPLYR
jgi:hypothetical protein